MKAPSESQSLVLAPKRAEAAGLWVLGRSLARCPQSRCMNGTGFFPRTRSCRAALCRAERRRSPCPLLAGLPRDTRDPRGCLRVLQNQDGKTRGFLQGAALVPGGPGGCGNPRGARGHAAGGHPPRRGLKFYRRSNTASASKSSLGGLCAWKGSGTAHSSRFSYVHQFSRTYHLLSRSQICFVVRCK